MTYQTDVMTPALQVAVPLWMGELTAMEPLQREHTRIRWARDASDAISAHGDVLQFGGGKPGEVAKVFNHLARGLAAGAYQPGGITFAGLHFEADNPDPPRETRRAEVRPPVIDAVRSL